MPDDVQSRCLRHTPRHPERAQIAAVMIHILQLTTRPLVGSRNAHRALSTVSLFGLSATKSATANMQGVYFGRSILLAVVGQVPACAAYELFNEQMHIRFDGRECPAIPGIGSVIAQLP
jgi:hypothetical protein